MGDPRARALLHNGASALVQRLCPRQGLPPAELARSQIGAWTLRLLARKPRALVITALANKLARIAWAVLMRQETYQPGGRRSAQDASSDAPSAAAAA